MMRQGNTPPVILLISKGRFWSESSGKKGFRGSESFAKGAMWGTAIFLFNPPFIRGGFGGVAGMGVRP